MEIELWQRAVTATLFDRKVKHNPLTQATAGIAKAARRQSNDGAGPEVYI